MEYTVKQLAELAGVSARTLRYYDEIGLLVPARFTESGYRIYETAQVDTLQKILFLKEMGMDLRTITRMIREPDFDWLDSLRRHLGQLEIRERQTALLIQTVKKTILQEEGKRNMTDQEKFEGLKKDMVKNNEEKYGREARKAYTDAVVDESNRKVLELTQEEYARMTQLSEEILRRLEEAVSRGESGMGREGKEIAALHKEWLQFYWPSYSPDAHKALGEMYTADQRFRDYYDAKVPGCAAFLRDALEKHITV